MTPQPIDYIFRGSLGYLLGLCIVEPRTRFLGARTKGCEPRRCLNNVEIRNHLVKNLASAGVCCAKMCLIFLDA